MNYAIDIKNSKVIQAIENLGITKEELQIRVLGDFGSKSTRDEIKQLRFDYYTKRLEETVKLIKEYIKSNTSTSKEFSSRPNFYLPENEVQSQVSNDKKKVFLNDKNKEILITALEEIKEEMNLPKRERPQSMAQPRSIKLVKIEQFKRNQKENFEKIKNLEEMKIKKALNDSSRFRRTATSAKRSQDQNSFNNTLKSPINLSVSEDEITLKLNKYYEKIEKSKQLHEKQLEMKREHVKSQLSIFKNDQKSLYQEDIIFKIIERTRAVSERKKEKVTQLKEKWERKRQKNEQRAKRLEEIEKEYHRNLSEKEENLMKKMSAVEKVIKKRKASLGKDIEMKIELQKLRDEEALIKLKRSQNIM